MKAVVCTHFGPPEDLVLTDLPEPEPAAGEAVVRVHAVGLNFYDTLIIAGRYQKKPAFPFSPGGEFGGIVEAVGPSVTDLKPGDAVIGYISYGALRERVAAPVQKLIRIDPPIPHERAAALTITYGTALYGLRDRGALKAGETLVVLGAAGGVGLAAVELGKLMGARVIACVSSDAKAQFVRAHGADAVINYEAEDLREALKREAGGRGVDVVFDPVGGRFSEAALRSCAWGGRHLVVGFAAGDIPKIPLNIALLKSCSIVGVYFGDYAVREPDAFRASIQGLARWASEGHLSCHVDTVYPLADIVAALKSLTGRAVMGKVIVRP